MLVHTESVHDGSDLRILLHGAWAYFNTHYSIFEDLHEELIQERLHIAVGLHADVFFYAPPLSLWIFSLLEAHVF